MQVIQFLNRYAHFEISVVGRSFVREIWAQNSHRGITFDVWLFYFFVHRVYSSTSSMAYGTEVPRYWHRYLYTTGYFKTISIIAHSSSPTQNCWTILSGAGAHGECATFEVWVEAFGAELMKPHGIIDRFFAREPRQVILKRRHHTTCMVFSHFSRFRLETAK